MKYLVLASVLFAGFAQLSAEPEYSSSLHGDGGCGGSCPRPKSN